VEKFQALGLSKTTLEAVAKKGFTEPSPIQAATIPLLLSGETDVIGQAQTGTGKTAAFGLPIIELLEPKRHVQALILAPTRELALQVSEEINSLKGDKDLRITAIYGGASMERQFQDLRRGTDIVVGTPGRVIDHIERGTLKIDKISFFVLDEADEMLNMGFIDDVENILKSTPTDKRMLFFSATMPDRILHLAQSFMRKIEMVQIEKKQVTASTVKQVYYEVGKPEKVDAIARIIDATDEFFGMVFTRTKNDADEVAAQLIERGYDADALHGDISQSLREKILDKFKKKRITVLVATDVAARGIDVNNLTHVINHSLPEDPEVYVHRIGRTGRAGRDGIAISLVTKADNKKLSFIEKLAKTKIQREKLPTGKEIIEGKRKKLVESILTQIEKSNYLPIYSQIADQIIEGLEEPKEVIAILLQRLYGKAFDEQAYRDFSENNSSSDRFGKERGGERRSTPSGRVRLFVALGKKDGYTPRRLVSFFEDETNTASRLIDDIAIMESYSFMTVPAEEADRILKHFKRPVGEKSLVERSQEKSKFTDDYQPRNDRPRFENKDRERSHDKGRSRSKPTSDFKSRDKKPRSERYSSLEMSDFKY